MQTLHINYNYGVQRARLCFRTNDGVLGKSSYLKLIAVIIEV